MIIRKNKLFNAMVMGSLCLLLACGNISSNAQELGESPKPTAVDDWGPMPSPDGKTIAFYSTRDNPKNLGRIFLMNEDGSDIRELNYPETGGHDAEPHWSPDGTMIAFTSQKMVDSIHTSSIYVMNSNGSDLREVWNNNDPMGATHFGEWFDDGSGFVYAFWKGDFTPDIYAVNLDGSGNRRLTFDQNSYKPYFQNRRFWFTSERNGKPELFSMDTHLGDLKNISQISGENFMFGSLLKDRFYFAKEGNREGTTAFYSMDHGGGKVKKIVEIPTSPAMFFNVSAVGNYITYSTPGPDSWDIHKVDISTGKVTQLVR